MYGRILSAGLQKSASVLQGYIYTFLQGDRKFTAVRLDKSRRKFQSLLNIGTENEKL